MCCCSRISGGMVFRIFLLAVLAFSCSSVCAQTLKVGALRQISGTSPFAGNTADHTGLQPGTNFPNSALAPSAAINPKDSNNIVCVWQQDRWSNGGCRGLVAAVTKDGGKTWKSVIIPGVSLCSKGSLARVSNPAISFGPQGNLYLIAVGVDVSTGQSAVLASNSVDGGLTWTSPVTLRSDAGWGNFNDSVSITADPFDAHTVYAVWDKGDPTGQPAWFTRSVDSGKTWETPRVIYDPGPDGYTAGNRLLVRKDGALLHFFSEGGGRSLIGMQISRDKGKTWLASVVTVAANMSLGTFAPETGDAVRAASGLFSVATDGMSGALYVVWQDARFSTGQIDGVAFAASSNGGMNWSSAIHVNQTPTKVPLFDQQASLPTISVAGNGFVAVSYYDFRATTTGVGTMTDAWIAYCKPTTSAPATDPANWKHELRLTNSAFECENAPLTEDGFFLGDSQSLIPAATGFVAVFTQATKPNFASVFFRTIGP